jgi:hypothetical protein
MPRHSLASPKTVHQKNLRSRQGRSLPGLPFGSFMENAPCRRTALARLWAQLSSSPYRGQFRFQQSIDMPPASKSKGKLSIGCFFSFQSLIENSWTSLPSNPRRDGKSLGNRGSSVGELRYLTLEARRFDSRSNLAVGDPIAGQFQSWIGGRPELKKIEDTPRSSGPDHGIGRLVYAVPGCPFLGGGRGSKFFVNEYCRLRVIPIKVDVDAVRTIRRNHAPSPRRFVAASINQMDRHCSHRREASGPYVPSLILRLCGGPCFGEREVIGAEYAAASSFKFLSAQPRRSGMRAKHD